MHARNTSPPPFDQAFEEAARRLGDSIVDGLAVTADEASILDRGGVAAAAHPAFWRVSPSEGESTSSTLPVVSVAKKITVSPPRMAKIAKTK